MPSRNYQRTVPELRKLASMFWPSELSEEAAKLSVIPILLKTQDEFIAVLSVPVPDLPNLFQVLNASSFSGNLFLKHLVILADFGGEQLQRVNSNFEMLFPSGQMEYLWHGKPHTYSFQVLPVTHLTNSRLGISSQKLLKERKLDKLLQDVAAILLFGSTCTDETTAKILYRCNIGDYLGQYDNLKRLLKECYVWLTEATWDM